ncbi:MAG: hypothetical protein K9J21_07220 [Bacteroidales bacterium]|nr:hypothetical protein [Bacteroidales bacterium]
MQKQLITKNQANPNTKIQACWYQIDSEYRERVLTLHKRLAALPKNPKVEKSIKRKQYLLKVASYFEITENKPFIGVFYFETI